MVDLRLSKIATDESVGEDDIVTTNDAPSPLPLHGHLHVATPQLVGLHHIQLPLVLDLDDLQQLGLPTPGGHSLCPALPVLQWFVDMFFLLSSLPMLVSMLPWNLCLVTSLSMSLLAMLILLHMTR